MGVRDPTRFKDMRTSKQRGLEENELIVSVELLQHTFGEFCRNMPSYLEIHSPYV